MDCADRSAASEALGREAAMHAHRQRARYTGPPPDVVDGIPCCAECGDPIPAARLAAVPGVGLCVECAEGG